VEQVTSLMFGYFNIIQMDSPIRIILKRKKDRVIASTLILIESSPSRLMRWTMTVCPQRFERLERFVSEMACLKIPNPYSVFELLRAKSRWIDLGREAGWSPVETMMALNS